MNSNEQIPNAPRDPLSEARRDFNRLGLAFFAMTAIHFLLANGLSYLGSRYFPAFASTEWFYWLAGSGTLYLAAMPAAALILRSVPRRSVFPEADGVAPSKPAGIGGFEFFLAVLICTALMQAGNLAGNAVNNLFSILTGRFSSSGLDEIMMQTNPLMMLAVVVVLGPLLEELVFRKLIIDRISKYGAATAMVASALMFGLCHGNLQQFFYAFAIGLFFGFVYLRTGNIRITVLLHMTVNFLGGFIPSMLTRWVYGLEGYKKLFEIYDELPIAGDQMTPEQVMELLETFSGLIAPLMLMLSWSFIMLGLACVGLYLLASERKKLTLAPCRPAETSIPRERRGEVIFLNVGMVLYIASMAAMLVMSFFM